MFQASQWRGQESGADWWPSNLWNVGSLARDMRKGPRRRAKPCPGESERTGERAMSRETISEQRRSPEHAHTVHGTVRRAHAWCVQPVRLWPWPIAAGARSGGIWNNTTVARLFDCLLAMRWQCSPPCMATSARPELLDTVARRALASGRAQAPPYRNKIRKHQCAAWASVLLCPFGGDAIMAAGLGMHFLEMLPCACQ
jgi:hypothetical protein